jgi:HEAT repeat protein
MRTGIIAFCIVAAVLGFFGWRELQRLRASWPAPSNPAAPTTSSPASSRVVTATPLNVSNGAGGADPGVATGLAAFALEPAESIPTRLIAELEASSAAELARRILGSDVDTRRSIGAALAREAAADRRLVSLVVELVIEETDSTAATRAGGLLRAFPEDAIGPLLAALEPDSVVRERARVVRTIGRLGTTAHAAAPTVARLLGDPDPEVASAASIVLASMSEAAVPALVSALAPGTPEIARIGSMRALHRIGVHSEAALPSLASALSDESYEVRFVAAQTIRALGSKAKSAERYLQAAIQHPDFDRLRDGESHPQIGGDGRWSARAEAIMALGSIGGAEPASIRLLESLLVSANPCVVLASIESLGALGPGAASALTALERVLENSKDGSWGEIARACERRHREAATKAIAAIRGTE